MDQFLKTTVYNRYEYILSSNNVKAKAIYIMRIYNSVFHKNLTSSLPTKRCIIF